MILYGKFGHTARDFGRRFLPTAHTDTGSTAVWLVAATEAVILCVIAVAVGRWAAPADPFGLHAAFPWLWIIPALLAMRYGTAIGVTAVIALVICWLGLPQLDVGQAMEERPFPKIFFLGGVILTLICAQFSDIWSARTRRLRAANA